MFDDIVAEITARVERHITARMDELKAFLKELVGNCATKQCVEDKFQAMNEVLSGIARRLEALEKKIDAISSGVFETKGRVDESIRNATIKHVQDTVMERGIGALKSWTRKANANIVYDSTVDPFTDQGLFDKVKGKANIALVGFTTDGDVFGGFYTVAVTRQSVFFKDPNMFIFSFESHGRCETPQRFAVKGDLKDKACVKFWKTDLGNGFVEFRVYGGCFFLGNEKSRTFCCNSSDGFEGIQDTTLTGKNGTYYKGPYHHCTRLVAVQLS